MMYGFAILILAIVWIASFFAMLASIVNFQIMFAVVYLWAWILFTWLALAVKSFWEISIEEKESEIEKRRLGEENEALEKIRAQNYYSELIQKNREEDMKKWQEDSKKTVWDKKEYRDKHWNVHYR